jgi:uncharacterized membrane protein YfcA
VLPEGVDLVLLACAIFGAALLYTAVGHAGASGYLAAMAFFSVAPEVMRPTALTLNILVASFTTVRLHRARLVNWRALVPLVAASIPCAFIGGGIHVPASIYRPLLGIVLLAAAAKLFFQPRAALPTEGHAAPPLPMLPGLATGALVGLLSGLTGTGGGIFLSPLLLFFGWAGARQMTGLTAPFILVNSIAGLAGNLLSLRSLPAELPYLVIAALAGAVVGTQLGIRWLSIRALQRVLAAVLLIAAGKFLFS